MSNQRERQQVQEVREVLAELLAYTPSNPADIARLATTARLAREMLGDVSVVLIEIVTGDRDDLVDDYLCDCVDAINRQRVKDNSPDRFVLPRLADKTANR